MRLWLWACATLVCASGCVGPHATGSLWALQNAQLDTVLFRTSDAARAQQAHDYEVTLADEQLAAERARVEALVQACLTAERKPLAISDGDRARDLVRLRIGDDAARLAQLANVALADWYVRRGNATGDMALCDRARAALNGVPESAQKTGAFDELGEATVTRSPVEPFTGEMRIAFRLYATGAVDAVTAASPLPQYLAAVYGGKISASNSGKSANAAQSVDEIAAAYPEWEPDALYAALHGVP